MSKNVSNTVEWAANDAQQDEMFEMPASESMASSITRPTSPRQTLPSSYSNSYEQSQQPSTYHYTDKYWEFRDARPILPKAAFFMGDLRDGLPMLNLQAAFLISARNFTEKQVGVLFFVFGITQFICLAPAGYYLDYSRDKIKWVTFSGLACASLTIFTVLTAAPYGTNMGLMILWKVLQGGVTSILPPGFNGVTLGIVGSAGFTQQVSKNRMMNHIGTALVVAVGSIIAYFLYPNIGQLFIVSPLFAIFFVYYMRRIKPTDVNQEAASALVVTSPTMTSYENMDEYEDPPPEGWDDEYEDNAPYVPPEILATPVQNNMTTENPNQLERTASGSSTPNSAATPSGETNASAGTWSVPSFNFGWGQRKADGDSLQSDVKSRRPQTPLAVLIDPTLLVFTAIVFFFHLANSTVLPLVMQSLKVEDPHTSILLSGLSILIAQLPMAYFAKLCGTYSPRWGRKGLVLVGLGSLTVRCFLLTILAIAKRRVQTLSGLYMMKVLILSTQLLDSVGAGIFGTMYIIVTSDISGGTGRFSLLMGMTTSAMVLGGTVSGYIGGMLTQDYGYPMAFFALGIMSLVPFFMYAFFMPETLPDYAKPKPKRRKRLEAIFRNLNKHRRSFSERIRRSFDRREQRQDPAASVAGTALVEII